MPSQIIASGACPIVSARHMDNIIAFPTFASAVGGAQSVRYSGSPRWRYARVTLANGEIVRVHRSTLPHDPRNWTAFNVLPKQ